MDEPTIATDPSTVTYKNLFAYCDNDPINRFDNGGQFWNVIAGAFIGGVIGGASQAISNLIDGKPILQDIATSAVKGALGGALTAALPGASTTINVMMSVGESIESDIKNGENIQTIAVNAALSAGFAAATSNGTIFSNKNIMEDTFSAVKKVLPGNHPSVKRTAKKFLKNTCKALSREIKSGIADGVFVNEVRDATEWYTGLYTGSKSTYCTLERANR